MKNIRMLTAACALVGALAAPSAHAWWHPAYSQRTVVTLDTGDAGQPLPASVTDAVVPVRLHAGNFDFLAAKDDGSDLRVVAADDKTPLPFMVERFDPVNELGLIWVRVGALAQGNAKPSLYVYAGDAEGKGPAAPRTDVFGQPFAAAWHFEPSNTQLGPITREANGLLGAALKLDGTPVTLPLPNPLQLDAPGAMTLALWAKPDAATETGVLAKLGDVTLARTIDQVELRAGSTKLAGGALPASAWAHVALTVGAGKATLYINGAPVGSTELLLPTQRVAGVQVGERYRGLIDEVQLLPTAQSEAWVKLAAASQGSDGRLVHATTEKAGAATAEGGGGYMGILVKNLTTDAWVVIGVLLLMFVIAVFVMIEKARAVARMGRANAAFMQRFRATLDDEVSAAPELRESALARLYQAGQDELARRRARGQAVLGAASLDAIRATLDAGQVRENHALNARMVLLTIAISGGPFLGLLGTVVGVMITFAAIAAAGDVNVNAIAPGIAAALLATVAGLSVAIPALFGYNWLASRIKTLTADMQIFVDEYVTRMAERFGSDAPVGAI